MQSSKRYQHIGTTEQKRGIAFEQADGKSAKIGRSRRKMNFVNPNMYTPEAQQLEMLQRRMHGQSINRIATEMRKDWDTVAKVVKSDEMQAEIDRAKGAILGMWEEFYGSLRRCVNTEMDAKMAWRALLSLGMVQPAPTSQKVEVTRTDTNTQSLSEQYRKRADADSCCNDGACPCLWNRPADGARRTGKDDAQRRSGKAHRPATTAC